MAPSGQNNANIVQPALHYFRQVFVPIKYCFHAFNLFIIFFIAIDITDAIGVTISATVNFENSHCSVKKCFFYISTLM